MEPQQASTAAPICDEMIPSISSASSPTLNRKHIKERGHKINTSTNNIPLEEVKIHTSRIKRTATTRRTHLLIHCMIVVAVLSWFGIQLYMTGSLNPEKSSFLPWVNSKERPSKIIEKLYGTLSSLSSWLSFVRSSDESIETQKIRSKQEQMEDDYIFIFYALLFVNLLAMFPSLFQRYMKSSKRKSATENGLEPSQHNNDEQLKFHLQQEQIDTEKRLIHHKLFYLTYLPPYLLATSADWLQGPYKYALYSSYGYTQRDIAHLFVVGYGSGMILGSIVGGLADGYGRKRLCLCYCIAYAISVACTHCKNYYILLLGRCGGGVGTSLLFSVFESWLIGAHTDRGLVDHSQEDGGEKWLAESFAVGTYGSSLVAIASGIVGNFIVARSGKMRPFHFGDEDEEDTSLYFGGYIAAFDACFPILICCAVLIIMMWEENYGEDNPGEDNVTPMLNQSINEIELKPTKLDYGCLKKHSSIRHFDDEGLKPDQDCSVLLQEVESQRIRHPGSQEAQHHHKDGMCIALWNGMVTVYRSPPILMCCIIGSFFEGAMYIFIFLWTPALTAIQRTIEIRDSDEGAVTNLDPHGDVDELPFGWIFSSFMVCCMLGTMSFSLLTKAGVSASRSLIWILALSAMSCFAMAIPFTNESVSSGAQTIQYAGMLLYEFCIGAYYPAIGTVKGTIVPEDQRAAIYNVFRLPLNLMVLLYLIGDFDTESSFLANGLMLIVACILQLRLVKSAGHKHSK